MGVENFSGLVVQQIHNRSSNGVCTIVPATVGDCRTTVAGYGDNSIGYYS